MFYAKMNDEDDEMRQFEEQEGEQPGEAMEEIEEVIIEEEQEEEGAAEEGRARHLGQLSTAS